MHHPLLIQVFTLLLIAFGMMMPNARPASSSDEKLKYNKQKSLDFSFYGTPVSISYNEAIIPEFPQTDAESIIAEHVRYIDKTQYNQLHQKLIQVKKELALNDWGYYKLVQRASNELTQANSNEAIFLQWVLLAKANFKTLLGANKANLLLLLKFNTPVYNWNYYYHKGERYFIMNEKATSSIAVYKFNPANLTKTIDLNLNSTPNLAMDKDSVAVNFQGAEYFVKYNHNLIAFYKAYPKSNLKIYFDAQVSYLIDSSLKAILNDAIENKSTQETISLLLAFVRNLPHKFDVKQFGGENYLFPAEVFHYGASDCEDRSFLLAYLIREYTELDVVGLKYDDHINIAVEYKWQLSHPKLEHAGESYAICDPSLENSEVGENRYDQTDIIEVIEIE